MDLHWPLPCRLYSLEEVKTEKELTKDEQIEIDELGDICDALKKAYDSKKAMDHERKIGKVSGAVNMAKLNQAGRKGVEAVEEADRLMTLYKKKYSPESVESPQQSHPKHKIDFFEFSDAVKNGRRHTCA